MIEKGKLKLTRGYSKAFTPHGRTGKRYLLDSIPAGLWRDVRKKAKAEQVSVRALILQLLTDWLRQPQQQRSK